MPIPVTTMRRRLMESGDEMTVRIAAPGRGRNGPRP
jgi:hypothetical protein